MHNMKLPQESINFNLKNSHKDIVLNVHPYIVYATYVLHQNQFSQSTTIH